MGNVERERRKWRARARNQLSGFGDEYFTDQQVAGAMTSEVADQGSAMVAQAQARQAQGQGNVNQGMVDNQNMILQAFQQSIANEGNALQAIGQARSEIKALWQAVQFQDQTLRAMFGGNNFKAAVNAGMRR
jgi:hypothetical protein